MTAWEATFSTMSVGDLYEVRCDNCTVSFPPGTKKCLHCGGRIGSRRRPAPPAPTMRAQTEAPPDFFADQRPLPHGMTDFAQLGADSEGDQEASGPRRFLRLGVNVLWIVGAILITVLQMCRGGG